MHNGITCACIGNCVKILPHLVPNPNDGITFGAGIGVGSHDRGIATVVL